MMTKVRHVCHSDDIKVDHVSCLEARTPVSLPDDFVAMLTPSSRCLYLLGALICQAT